jgi:hypothetical protein
VFARQGEKEAQEKVGVVRLVCQPSLMIVTDVHSHPLFSRVSYEKKKKKKTAASQPAAGM